MEALPDDMRQEVLMDHFRELHRTGQLPVVEGGVLDPVYLNALPASIRNELLEQDRIQNNRNNPNQDTNEMDTAAFLASLDPELRQAVMMGQEQMFSRPSDPLAEIRQTLRNDPALERANIRRNDRNTSGTRTPASFLFTIRLEPKGRPTETLFNSLKNKHLQIY